MESDPSGLTIFDRLRLTGFGIFIFTCMMAGITAALYIQRAYLGGTAANAPGQWAQAAFFLFLMFGAIFLGLLLTRLFCLSFVSLQTQKRWLAALENAQDSPYVKARGIAIFKYCMWALVPDRDAL
jgi:hypothetical protein